MADAPPPSWPPSEPSGSEPPAGRPAPGAGAEQPGARSIWRGRRPDEPDPASTVAASASEPPPPQSWPPPGPAAPPWPPPPPPPPSGPPPPPPSGGWPPPPPAPPPGPWAPGPAPGPAPAPPAPWVPGQAAAPPAPWAQPAGAPPWAQPPTGPIAAPPPVAAPLQPDEHKASPWLVVLPIVLAAMVLALVVVGARVLAGPGPSDEAIESPSGGVATTPSSSPAAPATTSPTTSPPSTTSTTRNPSTAPVDTATPQLKVAEPDGRFGVTVPRSWANVPTSEPDQAHWVPFVSQPDGFVPTDFLFAVVWAPANGCTLERCAEQVVERIRAATPGVTPVGANDTVNGLPAIRIEVTAAAQRLVAWVVVKGDRYWVPQLRGPLDGYDAQLDVARRVVATMTFG